MYVEGEGGDTLGVLPESRCDILVLHTSVISKCSEVYSVREWGGGSAAKSVLLCPTNLSRASWLAQLVHKNVT